MTNGRATGTASRTGSVSDFDTPRRQVDADAQVLFNTSMGRQTTNDLERKAGDVAALLRLLANERRLLILCKLVEYGETSVKALAEDVGLSASALSQHLAKMKAEGVVTFRRDSQTVWYRIADHRIEQLFSTLHRLFCRPSKRTR